MGKATPWNRLLQKITQLGPAITREDIHHKKVGLVLEIIQYCGIVGAIGIQPGDLRFRTAGRIGMLPKQP